MKSVSRWLALVCCALLLVGGLAACGGSDDVPEGSQDSTVLESTPGSVEDDPQEPEAPPEEILEPEDFVPLKGGSYASIITDAFSGSAFSNDPVAEEDLQLILRSGSRAPSARNSQPWHFTVVTGERVGMVQHGVDGTVLIVVCGLEDPPEGVDVSFDCALATQNMYLAAQSLGYGAHIYTGGISGINGSGDDPGRREELGIPDGYKAVAMLLIGNLEDAVDAASSATPRNDLDGMVNYVR